MKNKFFGWKLKVDSSVPPPPPWWMCVRWPRTLLRLLHRVAPSLKLSLEHLPSHRRPFDASALWYLPPRKFKGRLETLSTFLTWHGDIVVASRLPDAWEDLMCLLPTVASAHFKLRPGSGRTLNDRERREWKIKGFDEWNETFHQPCSSSLVPSCEYVENNPRVLVCICLWRRLGSSRRTLKRLVNYSRSHYEDKCEPDDKRKNYLFWCFCLIISCPLQISGERYYHAMSLFPFCSSILHCVLAA